MVTSEFVLLFLDIINMELLFLVAMHILHMIFYVKAIGQKVRTVLPVNRSGYPVVII